MAGKLHHRLKEQCYFLVDLGPKSGRQRVIAQRMSVQLYWEKIIQIELIVAEACECGWSFILFFNLMHTASALFKRDGRFPA